MARFYFRYTPVRRGLTGAEYVQEFLDENFPNVDWNGVISDGTYHYGFLEGSGDVLSKAITAVKGRFAAEKLSEAAFIGICYLLYNPGSSIEGEPVPTFQEYMSEYGISVSEDVLDEVKAFKKTLLKEVARTKFSSWNDSIADIAKSMVLLLFHYDDLTPEEKTLVDNLSDTIKVIYNKDTCISSYQNMISQLQNILYDYYLAKKQVEDATSVIEVMNVSYE